MAAAIARGWAGNRDRLLFFDADAEKARKLAGELGGEAADSNADLAERADVVVLAVKPGALEQAAGELAGVKAVISILGATSLEKVEAAFGEAEVGRIMPNLAVEVGAGVLCIAGNFSAEVRGRLDALGSVVEIPDSQFDVATALMGCSPAYFALVAEALAEAGVDAGLDEELVEKLVVEAAAGTGALMRVRRPAESSGLGHLAGGQHRSRPRRARARRRAGGICRRRARLAGADARMIALALSRGDVADYVGALFLVYIILILIRVLISWVPRMPYNPALRAVLDFVSETTDPYLNLFRRVLPPIGGGGLGIDLSPMIGIIVLYVLRALVVGLIDG